MDIILVPGLWLDADSWREVIPLLEDAGHHTLPLTMPGVGVPAPESSAVGMSDWVEAVVATIDDAEGPVVLVGHSGGGNVVWGAADARADRVDRVILIDTVPPPPGQGIGEFDVIDGVVPFPGWEHFPDEDVHDLAPAVRARTAPLTLSVPAAVPNDPIVLGDQGARFAVPVTLLMGGIDQAAFDSMIGQWGPFADEYRAIADAEVVRIGSGHWPQFSAPARLAALLLAAVSR
ncbi:alpha/beta fold hydrolase [Microbacterium sp. NPDC058345]|uniref:alpha/beta fold hydrolase n=1 Tax=Microbacterium sp. NPDC058345 TaxID=3346455 RepID=UPI00365C6EBB